MYEQWDVKDHLMPGKWDFRETVLLLAAHPAQEAYEASHNPSLPTVTETGQLSAVQQSVSSAETNLLAVSLDALSVFHSDLVIRKRKPVLEISNSASAELRSRIGGIFHAE